MVPRDRQIRPGELVRIGAIARRYYLDGASKTDLADEFGISRFKVARLLDEARESGLVRIEVALPPEIDGELSDALRSAYGLKQAIVVAAPEERADPGELRAQLGRIAADYLTEILEEDDVLGLACSRTLNATTLAMNSLARCTVVQLTGALSGVNVEANSVELVRRVASLARGPAYPIYAPLVVPDAATAQALRKQPQVADAMQRYRTITKAMVAIGSWDPPESMVRGAVAAAEARDLARHGSKGEVCARLLTEDGTPLDTDFNARVIAITLEQLKMVPEVIAVAGGARKAGAIRAVLRSEVVTSLITDAAVARKLL